MIKGYPEPPIREATPGAEELVMGGLDMEVKATGCSRAARMLWLPMCWALLALAAACAKRPAPVSPGPRRPAEEVEVQLGKAADQKIREEFDVYTDKPELVAYVASVGGRVATVSERSALSWHFEVLDSPDANSFSLPGGYVYVTRGLLARLNLEDDLAAALAHEIAHVAAKHAMAELSKLEGPSLSAAGPSLFADPHEAPRLGQLTDLALKLALQGFPLEREREADELGAIYFTRAGYNPRGDLFVLRALQMLRAEDPARAEPWFASHPSAEARIANLKTEITDLKESGSKALLRPLRRDDYLLKLDGLSLGSGTKAGYVSGGRYVSTRESLTLDVPPGWSATPGAGEKVLQMSRAAEGYRAELRIQTKLTPGTPTEAARRYAASFSKEGLEPLGPLTQATLPVGEGAVAHLKGRDARGRSELVRMVFLGRFDRLIVLSMTVPEEKAAETEQMFMDLAGSIKYLSPSGSSGRPDARLALRRTKPGDTWESIAAGEVGSADFSSKLASFNGLTPNKPPPVGTLLKIPPRSVFEDEGADGKANGG